MRQDRQDTDRELLRFPPTGVARSGYQWIPGHYRPSNRPKLCLKDGFLEIRDTSLGMSAKSFSSNVCTQFANLQLTPDAALEFANKHGRLGLRKSHYHVNGNKKGYAERYTEWEREISVFQQTFKLWKIVDDKNGRDLQKFAEGLDPHGLFGGLLDVMAPHKLPKRENRLKLNPKADPFKLAMAYVLGNVNDALYPGITISRGLTCADCGAPLAIRQAPEITSHVSYSLAVRDGNNGPRVESKLTPDRLLSEIWLQFSEAIIGERKIRRCEAPDCRKWMDVTSARPGRKSARPGARRMHLHCAERLRKRRKRKRKP